MIEFIVAVDPRPNTKARHFVSIAQALDRGLVGPCCHARKRDRFSAHRKPQKVPDRLGLLRHADPPLTHFFPRRAPFFRIYVEQGNKILIVNLDSDESTQVLRKFIEFAGTTDPIAVVKALEAHKDWKP
jgi:hypothetical protein